MEKAISRLDGTKKERLAIIIRIIRCENPEKFSDIQCDLYPEPLIFRRQFYFVHIRAAVALLGDIHCHYCHRKGTASWKQERTYSQDC